MVERVVAWPEKGGQDMEDFITRLTSGPSFLFLGQDYLRLETSEDLFLSQVIRKYNSTESHPRNYNTIFASQVSKHAEEAISWMLTRCMHLPVPQPLEIIAGHAWSGVFTSAFDDIIDRAFRSEWREIQTISDDSYRPSEPRNRSRLHIWHLFGALTATEHSGWPPLRQEEFWQRQGMATVLARRLPELVTPLGVLAFEGYSSQHDWFSPQEFFLVVNALMIGQAHWFSATGEVEQDPRLRSLINQGKLVLHKESLAQCLLHFAEAGRIKLGEKPEDIEFAHQVRIRNKRQSIPARLWNEISSTAHVLVESTFLPLPPQSKDQRYADFRHFLFESSYCPPWEGYARDFAFKRDFEWPFRQEIYARLRSAESRGTIVLLHGQTGSGKTVALGRLAYEIQKEGNYPVLFIARTMRRVKREAIDSYCEWAEDKGAFVTLIIWDGMQRPGDYYEMLRYLQSRGRKVLLVGSCYRLPQEQREDLELKEAQLIEAPIALTHDEIGRFSGFIGTVDPLLDDFMKKRVLNIPEPFLVFLYRLLPPSRTAIRSGIDKELSFAESSITSQTLNKTIKSNVNTLLGQLLQQAGFVSATPMLTEEPYELAGESVTELKELIGLVMVPGQFNLPCPYELLIRSMKKGFSDDFVDILRMVDIFHWTENATGDLLIGPRSSLEAELIVQQRMGGALFEVEYATKLLSAVQIDRLFEQQELQFAIDLIRSMGPNGKKPQYYRSYFSQMAECLEEIRTQGGVASPRLMLQESMLYREAAKLPDEQENQDRMLEKSEKVSRRALDILGEQPRDRQLRSQLRVDLASTYGQMAHQISDLKARLHYASMAHAQCVLAHVIDPQNFYPIDVIVRTAHDLLQAPEMGAEQRLQLEESVYHAFNLADAEAYTGRSLESLNSWKVKLFALLRQRELSDQAFDALLQQGSAAGIYIRAAKMVDFIFQETSFTAEQRSQCEQAYRYLLEFKDSIENDSKCLFLLLKVWWIWKSGMQLFSVLRTALPFTESDWVDCKRLAAQLLDCSDFSMNLKIKYLEAVASFHLRDFSNGFQLFNELARESEYYGRRVTAFHLWSDAHGQSLVFNGTVVWVNDKGRGEIQVNEIQRRIPFLVHDTGRSEVKQGDSIPNFRIAFSMRGPLADFRE